MFEKTCTQRTGGERAAVSIAPFFSLGRRSKNGRGDVLAFECKQTHEHEPEAMSRDRPRLAASLFHPVALSPVFADYSRARRENPPC